MKAYYGGAVNNNDNAYRGQFPRVFRMAGDMGKLAAVAADAGDAFGRHGKPTARNVLWATAAVFATAAVVTAVAHDAAVTKNAPDPFRSGA